MSDEKPTLPEIVGVTDAAPAPKEAVRHLTTFMGGRMTPTESHRQSIRKRCLICGGPPAIQIRVFVPLGELIVKNPEMAAAIIATNPAGPFIPAVDMTYGKMVRVSDSAFCDRCKVQGERAAAKGPSSALVEISRGPKDAKVVQVPKQYRDKARRT